MDQRRIGGDQGTPPSVPKTEGKGGESGKGAYSTPPPIPARFRNMRNIASFWPGLARGSCPHCDCPLHSHYSQ
eukprot:4491657-Alexandrium_andersonii.AAC.1